MCAIVLCARVEYIINKIKLFDLDSYAVFICSYSRLKNTSALSTQKALQLPVLFISGMTSTMRINFMEFCFMTFLVCSQGKVSKSDFEECILQFNRFHRFLTLLPGACTLIQRSLYMSELRKS